MKNIVKILLISTMLLSCLATSVFAVPVKVDDEREKATATETVKPTQKSESKPTASATAKATVKPTSTAKATETIKPTAKPNSTAKASDDNDESSDEDKIVLSDESALVVDASQEPSLNIQNGSELFENKKYLTKGGAFLWFLLTLILSAVISFFISYRFYMMGRKDNRLIAEIRALKRDIDSKMVGTINGFSEPDVSVLNNNKGYAKENSSIHSGASQQVDEEDNEIYKKWESQINRVQKSIDEKNSVSGAYGKNASGNVERRRPVKRNNMSVSGKLKNVLNDIFPFDKK